TTSAHQDAADDQQQECIERERNGDAADARAGRTVEQDGAERADRQREQRECGGDDVIGGAAQWRPGSIALQGALGVLSDRGSPGAKRVEGAFGGDIDYAMR